MFDIHSHILPHLDDGAKTLEESMEIALYAVENGITNMIATPHYDREDPEFNQKVKQGVKELNQALERNRIPLTIHMGTEAFLNPETLMDFEKKKILTLNNSRYVLVEFPLEYQPPQVQELLYQIRLMGYTPIIAHPERYRDVQRDPNVLKGWEEQGNLVQINATSIVGVAGRSAQTTAKHLIRHNMVHLIGSDTHSPRNRRPRLKEAIRMMEDWIKKEDVEKIIGNNRRVFENKEILMIDSIKYPDAYNFLERLKINFKKK